MDVHRDDLLHPGDQLGCYRLPLVCLLMITSEIKISSLEIDILICFYLAYGINGSIAVILRAPASLHAY